MNYTAGTHVTADRPSWNKDIDPLDRTPFNATWTREGWDIRGCEWLPPHQRLVVRIKDADGNELTLTRHELHLNGVRHG